jgi:hypothetical protein
MFKSACFLLAVSLFLISGCGKDEKKKADKKETVPGPVKAAAKVSEDKPNLAINPSFEEFVDFEGITETIRQKPRGWITQNQFLNDSNGWSGDEAHSGKRSLKIENIGGTDAQWIGDPITVDKPLSAFKASVWTKTKDIKGENGKLRLVFDVYLETKDGNEVKRTVSVDIPKTDHDWEKAEGNLLFAGNIKKLVPYLVFSEAPGIVWFDDLELSPVAIGFSSGKTLFDSNRKDSAFNVKPLPGQKDAAVIYEVKGPKNIFSSDFIPVEEGKIYKLSGEFKAIGNDSSKLYFGYAPYTEDKRLITTASITWLQGTETSLSQPCKASDKTIYIKSSDNWVTGRNYCAAFDDGKAEKFSEVPNFNLSSMGIEKIRKVDDAYELTFRTSCGKSYPAGTKVREHQSTGGYIYNAAAGRSVTNAPLEFAGHITLNKDINVPKLRPKTRYVKIIIRANYQAPKAILEFKNIKMESLPMEKINE